MSLISRVWVIYKKEILTFLYTPTFYVCLALFTFLANYLNFFVGNFFQRDEASLANSFFHWHPWLYTIFAPAICMRLWSEEYRQKTMELLLTMSFRPWQIICGKFFAAWTVLLLALAFTFPIVITLVKLGPPDAGTVISGYLGSALLSGTFLAIAIAAASLTKNQFISYILGASLCGLLLMLGSEVTLNAVIRMFPGVAWLSEWLSSLSMFSHFKYFQRGMIPLSGIIYFISTSCLGLYFAHLSLSRLRH